MPSRWTSAWRRRRPCSTTRWSCRTATEAIDALRADGRTLEFIKDQYRHCKPILALGAGDQLLEACGIDTALPDGQPDPGLIIDVGRERRRPTSSSPRSPSIGISPEKPIRRACEARRG